jgi:hypothetical protein
MTISNNSSEGHPDQTVHYALRTMIKRARWKNCRLRCFTEDCQEVYD